MYFFCTGIVPFAWYSEKRNRIKIKWKNGRPGSVPAGKQTEDKIWE